MAIDWINGFFIPTIEITIIGGITITILYFIGKGLYKVWSRSVKFFWRYKLPFFSKPYPEKKVLWVMNCIEQGIGYYDAKKLLLVKMFEQSEINEIMWIYDQVLNEMILKGGKDNNGRKFERSDRKDEGKSEELPTVKGSS